MFPRSRVTGVPIFGLKSQRSKSSDLQAPRIRCMYCIITAYTVNSFTFNTRDAQQLDGWSHIMLVLGADIRSCFIRCLCFIYYKFLFALFARILCIYLSVLLSLCMKYCFIVGNIPLLVLGFILPPPLYLKKFIKN